MYINLFTKKISTHSRLKQQWSRGFLQYSILTSSWRAGLYVAPFLSSTHYSVHDSVNSLLSLAAKSSASFVAPRRFMVFVNSRPSESFQVVHSGHFGTGYEVFASFSCLFFSSFNSIAAFRLFSRSCASRSECILSMPQ